MSTTESSAITGDTLIPTADDTHEPTSRVVPGTLDHGDSIKETKMPPSIPPPANSGMQYLIDKAIDDLANRLSIAVSQIKLAETKEVVWPDSSLGCPQKGMQYSQVLTEGYLILLDANGQIYEYHASSEKVIVHCKNPMPPIRGTPLDQ